MLVICWASPLPYTGFDAAASRWASGSRGASPAPTTTRAMVKPSRAALTDQMAAVGSARLPRLIRSHSAITAVTTSNAVMAATS